MRLGEVIRAWRMRKEMSLRDVAEEMRIAPATLLRIEQGRGCDSGTLARVLAWMFEEGFKP